ncbi:APC family permease [Nonomuraea sp. C10]|uniref:APC family permease n=1 Tax=Nonomuraea sp. C10 TaxID=2600577 RepID=UPI0011CE8EDE|nr:APC family permease [Nonomuraea sp. C10]TXK34801.1 amino acid permease [Nonomuraea sp. C10]
MTTVPYQQDPAKTRRSPLSGRRLQLRHGEGDKRHLTSLQGLSALSLDALSSVAYGPEAAALVLAGAGAAAVALTLPITIAIAVLLLILVFSYRQVIAAHPDGGGSYGVAKAELGRRAGLLAAAALVVDYVLTIAVSLAAAAANLASAFPVLRPYLVETCLAGVLLLTVINLFGVSDSARFLMLPMSLFVVSVLGVVAVGLARSGPAATVGTTEQIVATEALTVMLILRAFSSGCSSLTGIEAIANGVPMFRKPRVKRAQHTELMLGALLATMLIGLAVLIRRDHVVPREGVTILAQLVAGSYGTGWAFYGTNIVVALGLGLAANTSFGGLPVLLSLLAKDRRLPSLFALRTERPVYRYGVAVAGLLAAILLIAVDGDPQRLIPMFAIGVFIGFTMSQGGMVKHWHRLRPPRWRRDMLLNGTGALLTCVAALVLLVSKFTEGAWAVAIVIPLLILLFARIERYYGEVAAELEIGAVPARPARPPAADHPGKKIIIPVGGIDAATQRSVSAAMALGGEIVLVSVCFTEESRRALHEAWDRWDPGVPLEVIVNPARTVIHPLLDYIRQVDESGSWTVVLIPILEPRHFRYRFLHNQRGLLLAAALRERSDVVVCLLPFHLRP